MNTKMPRYWTQNNLKERFPDKVKLRVRFSLDNLKLEDDVLNIPLFTADQTDRSIGSDWVSIRPEEPFSIYIRKVSCFLNVFL